MPFVAIPNGAKVEHLATVYNRNMATVMGGVFTPGGDFPDVATTAAALKVAWETWMVPEAQSPYHYLGCRVTMLDSADGEQFYAPSTAIGAGGSDNNVPPSLSACISLRTNERSRRGRGRLFWPIITHDALWEAQTYTLTDVYRTGLSTQFQGYLTAAGATDLPPAVVSRMDHTARLITSFSIDSRVDHQRRRDG
jgi:hypothetical protein